MFRCASSTPWFLIPSKSGSKFYVVERLSYIRQRQNTVGNYTHGPSFAVDFLPVGGLFVHDLL